LAFSAVDLAEHEVDRANDSDHDPCGYRPTPRIAAGANRVVYDVNERAAGIIEEE
jgi:hypothetical protein